MSDENTEMITVIHIRPGKVPKVIEIRDELPEMQRLVGGMIQEYMPFYDEADERIQDVALICNDEGKVRGMMPNRTILESYMKEPEIICGDFFLCYAPYDSERFLSLPEDLRDKFCEKFYYPEVFYRTGTEIIGRKYDPLPESVDRDQQR